MKHAVYALALLAGLAAFFVWIARLNEGDQKRYDIFFSQAVNGLAKGSQVSFSGVPVGKIDKIEQAEKQLDCGEGVPHETASQRLRHWHQQLFSGGARAV